MTTANLYLVLVALVGIRLGWVLRSSIRPMIEITAEPKAPVEVELVGATYKVTPPKTALTLKLAIRSKTAQDDPTLMIDTIYEIVDSMFGRQSKAVQKRLDDPKDALDIEHITDLMNKVIEASAAVPTT